MTTHVFIKEITEKLTIRENYESEENKCTLFVVILQVKTLIAIVGIQAARKKSANNIKRALNF